MPARRPSTTASYSDGELVIADDSGLEVDALQGAPGVRSARYAADEHSPEEESGNSDDEANNARLLRELHDVPDEYRTGRFVCVIAVARNGHTLATFHGKAEGIILHARRGSDGFGYDPLFFFPQIEKTFAELTAEEKARYSHRGAAFRQFLEWADHFADLHPHKDSVTFVTARSASPLRYPERAFEIAVAKHPRIPPRQRRTNRGRFSRIKLDTAFLDLHSLRN